jgi:hypothetical protein
MDLQGRILKTQTFPASYGDMPVHTAGLPKGMLLAVWQTQKGIVTRKIILR